MVVQIRHKWFAFSEKRKERVKSFILKDLLQPGVPWDRENSNIFRENTKTFDLSIFKHFQFSFESFVPCVNYRIVKPFNLTPFKIYYFTTSKNVCTLFTVECIM